MKQIDPRQIEENFIRLIGRDWMLVTAGKPGDFNTMTASWGGVGELWNRPVAFVFIRPQRHTFRFTEREQWLTLSFFGEEFRPALQLCGTRSGRDCDKAAEAGLTPVATPQGNVTFAGASLVLECRKLYADDLRAASFADRTIIDKLYPGADFHRMYVVEIVTAFLAE